MQPWPLCLPPFAKTKVRPPRAPGAARSSRFLSAASRVRFPLQEPAAAPVSAPAVLLSGAPDGHPRSLVHSLTRSFSLSLSHSPSPPAPTSSPPLSHWKFPLHWWQASAAFTARFFFLAFRPRLSFPNLSFFSLLCIAISFSFHLFLLPPFPLPMI